MWKKNIVEPDRPQMTVWHNCFACWICKAANTHSEYVIFIAFPLQQYLRERASVLRCTNTAFSLLFDGQVTVSHNLTERHVDFLVQVKTPYHTASFVSNNLSLHSSSLIQVSVNLVGQPGCTRICQWHRTAACKAVIRAHVFQKWRRSCRIWRRFELPCEIISLY